MSTKRILLPKLISIILALALFVSPIEFNSFPLVVHATSGGLSSDIQWDLTAGTLTLTGTGSTPKYKGADDLPWYSQASSITKVVVGEGITALEDFVFAGLPNVTSIKLPDSLTLIRSRVFTGMQITSLTLPKNVKHLSSTTLDGMPNLSSVNVAEGNAYWKAIDGIIYNAAGTVLYSCPQGKSGAITIPANVTLGSDGCCFYKCSKITSITFTTPEEIVTIPAYCFTDCTSLTSISDFPCRPLGIGDYSFRNTKVPIAYSTGGNTVAGMYGGNTAVAEVHILTNGVIDVFGTGSSTATAHPATVKIYSSLDATTFSKKYAEYGWLKYITDLYAYSGLGYEDFCTSKGITFHTLDLPTAEGDIGDIHWTYSKNASGKNVLSIVGSGASITPDYASAESSPLVLYSALADIIDIKGVATLGQYTIQAVTNLDDNGFIADEHLKTIGNNNFAVSRSTELNTFTIPASVENIQSGFLLTCDHPVTVNLASTQFFTQEDDCLYNKAKTILIRINPYKTGTLDIADTVTEIAVAAGFNSRLSSVNIPASVKVINTNAFRSTKLSSISFASNSNLTKIGSSVFQASTLITSLDLSTTKLTSLGNNFASGCNLTDLKLPNTFKYSTYMQFTGSTCKDLWIYNRNDSAQFYTSVVAYHAYTGTTQEIYARSLGCLFIPLDAGTTTVRNGNTSAVSYTPADKTIRVTGSGAVSVTLAALGISVANIEHISIDSSITDFVITDLGSGSLANLKDITCYNATASFSSLLTTVKSKNPSTIIFGFANAGIETTANTKGLQFYPLQACGDTAYWYISTTTTTNDTLNIIGQGTMRDYASAAVVPWSTYLAVIKKVNISNSVTYLGNYALKGITNTIDVTSNAASYGSNVFNKVGTLTLNEVATYKTGTFSGATLGNVYYKDSPTFKAALNNASSYTYSYSLTPTLVVVAAANSATDASKNKLSSSEAYDAYIAYTGDATSFTLTPSYCTVTLSTSNIVKRSGTQKDYVLLKAKIQGNGSSNTAKIVVNPTNALKSAALAIDYVTFDNKSVQTLTLTESAFSRVYNTDIALNLTDYIQIA